MNTDFRNQALSGPHTSNPSGLLVKSVMAFSVEELIATRDAVERELASRKATLQKQLASLAGIRPTRAPRAARSDKGKPRTAPKESEVVAFVPKTDVETAGFPIVIGDGDKHE